jgi:glucosamine-6-phosphate deaminase
MRVLIRESVASAASYAAQAALSFISRVSNPVIGLATGNTQLPLYRAFAASCRSGATSFRHVQSFNVDEYVGLNQLSPHSFAFYMRQHFIEKTDVSEENVHLIDGSADNAEAEAERYESLIKHAGGIGLQLLSIGRNGHIGFNEPGADFGARTHVEKLAPRTIAANRADLPDPPPEYAITMGIGTILDAAEIVMLATGHGKAAAVCDFLEGPISKSCPASALRLHHATTVVLDPEAAGDLRFKERYEYERS